MPKTNRKQARTWAKEGVDIATLDGKLVRADRETSVSFYETGTKNAEITTASPTWQNRLEGLDVVPFCITRFSDDQAEIRYYNKVPLNFIKLPANGKRGTKLIETPRKSATQWKKIGVEVSHQKDYTIRSEERETGIHFCESDKTAWILTSSSKWQKRIESLGIQPDKIISYTGTKIDQREYSVPVSFIKLPSRGRGRPKKNEI